MKKRMTKLNNRSIENIQIEVEEKLETRDRDSIHGSRRFHGGGHGCPFWYTCLDNPMDRGAWWVTIIELQSDMTEVTEHTCMQL